MTRSSAHPLPASSSGPTGSALTADPAMRDLVSSTANLSDKTLDCAAFRDALCEVSARRNIMWADERELFSAFTALRDEMGLSDAQRPR